MHFISDTSHHHAELDWLGLLAALHADFVGQTVVATIYAGEHRRQLATIQAPLSGTFDPYPANAPRQTIFLEIGDLIVHVEPHRILSSARWVDSSGEVPCLVVEIVREDSVLEIETGLEAPSAE